MIHFYYDQTPDEGGDLIEFTERVNLSDRNVKVTTNAEQGSIGTNSFVVDDPDGSFSVGGHRRVLIIEDEAPAENQLVYWGYTAARRYGRYDGPTIGGSRKIVLELTDVNTVIGRRVMAGNDSDRPEETDNERIAWALGTSEANAFDDVTTFVPGTDDHNMSDSNYNGQMLQSIIDDCAQQSSKNYYMRTIWDTSDYVTAFWYGSDNEDLAISDLRISNVLSEIDNVNVWGGSDDAELTRDPSRVYSGVFGNYDGGWVYRTLPATVDDFANRDTISSWPNVRRQTRAENRADRYLTKLDTEEDTITVSILVPPANVNDAMAGDQIRVHFTHLPEYNAWRPCRILSRTVTFVTPQWYQIDYTITPNGVASNIGETIGGYLCTEFGYQVPLSDGGGNNPMRVNYGGAYNPFGGTGDSYTDYGEKVELYKNVTYVVVTSDISFIGPQPLTPMFSNLNDSTVYHGDIGTTDCNFVPTHTLYCPPRTTIIDTLVWPSEVVPGDPTDCIARMSFLPWTGHNPEGSSWSVTIYYVSGPDPRFEDLAGCPYP